MMFPPALPLRAAFAIAAFTAAAALCVPEAEACTSFLVTKGASVDGSTMITYAADSHTLYGELTFTPAARHPKGSKREIRDWDSGKLLGSIDQVEETFRVVGNMNEHQVVIGETTFGGREELKDPKGGIDYGSMMFVALERAKTAREAIRVMTGLANEYGYYSSGETFSLSDPNEVWMLDLIGKGPKEKGVVWVACKVPDGYVSVHANQPRIRQFPRNDPEQCVYAEDVVTFARKSGYYQGADEAFSFMDAYAPPTCRDKRVRDARVWSFYNRVAPSLKIPADYPLCREGAAPLPVWVKPDAKLSAATLMAAMRDHFEDTPFEMRHDVGAGPFALPYRWRPLTWKANGKTYVNERAIATQQTGFSFVSQSRAWLPGDIGGLLWFSVDDTATSVYVPMYAGIREAPKAFAVGTGTFERFSWESAFWVFNWVSNFTYLRYGDMIVDVQKHQRAFESEFFKAQPDVEKEALALHEKSPALASKHLTQVSAQASEKVVARWRDLGPELLVKYMDGNVRDDKGKVTHPELPKEWYARIAHERGDRLVMPEEAAAPGASSTAAPSASAAPPPASASPVGAPPASGCAVTRVPADWRVALLLAAALGFCRARRRARAAHGGVRRVRDQRAQGPR